MRGEMVEQGLQLAADVANAKVAWLHPDRPVLPALFNQTCCDLDKAASTAQISCSIRKMGLVSNILTQIVMPSGVELHKILRICLLPRMVQVLSRMKPVRVLATES